MDLGIRVHVIASKLSFLWHQAGPGGKHLKAKVKRLLIGFEKASEGGGKYMGEPQNVSLQECIALYLDNIAWLLSQIMPHFSIGFSVF